MIGTFVPDPLLNDPKRKFIPDPVIHPKQPTQLRAGFFVCKILT